MWIEVTSPDWWIGVWTSKSHKTSHKLTRPKPMHLSDLWTASRPYLADAHRNFHGRDLCAGTGMVPILDLSE